MGRFASWLFFAVGVLFLVLTLAAFCGLNELAMPEHAGAPTSAGPPRVGADGIPTFASVGAAAGFAIASGLCMVAAAIANRWEVHSSGAAGRGPKEGANRSAPPEEVPPGPSMDIGHLPQFPG